MELERGEEELVRINIMRGGIRSTISMDWLLGSTLAEMVGGETGLRNWVQDTVDRLEAEWANKTLESRAGDRVHAKSGLSRMVQREALKYVLTTVKNCGV